MKTLTTVSCSHIEDCCLVTFMSQLRIDEWEAEILRALKAGFEVQISARSDRMPFHRAVLAEAE